MNYIYRHTQIGYFIIWLFLGIVAFIIISFAIAQQFSQMIPIVLICVLLIALFGTLTVSLSEEKIRIEFGIGLIARNFRIDQILSVKAVKNKWYHGWGIHMLMNGWIYNVSGFDAVELQMKNGRVYRVGTDEPEALEAAIKSRIVEAFQKL